MELGAVTEPCGGEFETLEAAGEENDGEAETGHDLEAEGVGSVAVVYDREEVPAEAATRAGGCR